MHKLDEWAKGRPILIAIVAQQIAFGAEPCFQALHALKSGEPIEGYRQPSKIKDWIGFYKNHKKIIEYLKRVFKDFGELAEIGISISELLIFNRKQRRLLGSKRYNNKLRKELESLNQEDWSEIKKFWKEVYRISLDDINSDITGEYDQELRKKVKGALKDPEMLFFLRVWAPCWLLYGDFPPKLLKSARFGDIETLEKLISLDGSVIHDSRIAEYLHKEASKRNKSNYNHLMKATLRGPKAKITLQKIKMNFAGLISAISSALGYRLTEPEIRALFDAVSADTGRGEINEDIPDAPEAFSKAIQRESQFWNIIPQPDKK